MSTSPCIRRHAYTERAKVRADRRGRLPAGDRRLPNRCPAVERPARTAAVRGSAAGRAAPLPAPRPATRTPGTIGEWLPAGGSNPLTFTRSHRQGLLALITVAAL